MGQAKRRGSFEDRKAESIARTERARLDAELKQRVRRKTLYNAGKAQCADLQRQRIATALTIAMWAGQGLRMYPIRRVSNGN